MFKGKVALVTGASRGIGLAIAQDVLKHGGKVCLTARKEDGLNQAVRQLGAQGDVFSIVGASHDGDHRRQAVQQVIERFGALDMLVNNAGTNPYYGDLMDVDLKLVEKIQQVNLVAPLGWVQEAWKVWMRENGGVILNVASIAGLVNLKRIGAYNISKAALIHLTRQLALELAPGVRVNAIAPGIVKTRFSQALYEDREETMAAATPSRRLGVPEDTVGAARFLISQDASWITGETVVVDGGMTLVTGCV